MVAFNHLPRKSDLHVTRWRTSIPAAVDTIVQWSMSTHTAHTIMAEPVFTRSVWGTSFINARIDTALNHTFYIVQLSTHFTIMGYSKDTYTHTHVYFWNILPFCVWHFRDPTGPNILHASFLGPHRSKNQKYPSLSYTNPRQIILRLFVPLPPVK